MSSSHGDNLKKPAKNKHNCCRSQKQVRGAAELAAVSPDLRLLLVAKQGADVWHLLVQLHHRIWFCKGKQMQNAMPSLSMHEKPGITWFGYCVICCVS
jgi:hypothetical protein